MYSPFNKYNRFVFGEKTILTLTTLITALVLGTVACHSDGPGETPPVPGSTVYVHGRILHTDSTGISKARIILCKPSSKCDASADMLQPETFSGPNGKYSFALGRAGYSQVSQSFNVRLKLKSSKHYIIPEPSKLKLVWNVYQGGVDSMQVDFTLTDSTKE
jgi:hypothetical protein